MEEALEVGQLCAAVTPGSDWTGPGCVALVQVAERMEGNDTIVRV
jgi:hypothetical protein